MVFSIKKFAVRLSRLLLDCIFPKLCLGCGREGEYVCADCRDVFRPTYPSVCFGCQRAARPGRFCLSCEPRYAFEGIFIAADYEDEMIKKLLRAYKYRFVRELNGELGRLLNQKLEKAMLSLEGNSLLARRFFQAGVIPVPLSPRRRKWRGFNQAELLAGQVADFAGLVCLTQVLQRRHRRAQATLQAAERASNVVGAFWAAESVPPLVILVDDVVTTGSTLQACAKALKEAGAEEVWCLVVAKG